MQNSQRKDSQRGYQDQYLADCRHAHTEDERCPENEKQTDGAFNRYVMDRDAGMIGDKMIRSDWGAELRAFSSSIAEQEN